MLIVGIGTLALCIPANFNFGIKDNISKKELIRNLIIFSIALLISITPYEDLNKYLKSPKHQYQQDRYED